VSVVFAVTFGLLSLAGVLVLVRLLRGRSTLDRIAALDVLITLLVAGTCAGMAVHGDGANTSLLTTFALLAFLGSVTAARLVEHKEPYR
jgi:multicomponent Na+:H+ antiporter subunit F